MKRQMLILLLLVGTTTIAQIKGNGKLATKSFPANGLTDLEIGLYADILIDLNRQEGIQIKTDDNLFDQIDTEIVHGTLKLNQKEWIQPSARIKIVIGAPYLRRLRHGTNDDVHVTNLNADRFNVVSLNGRIFISGETDTLSIASENGTVNAKETMAREVYLNIWGNGEAILKGAELLDAKLSKEAGLTLLKQPKTIKGTIKKALENAQRKKESNVRYISFKIKNNSLNRNNFYVVGPKPDGKKFSYGFPLMPGKVRKEKWTTGTKIYKVGSLGIKKLLVTIKETDENTVVNLF